MESNASTSGYQYPDVDDRYNSNTNSNTHVTSGTAASTTTTTTNPHGGTNNQMKLRKRVVSLIDDSTAIPVPCYTISNDDADAERARSLLQNIATQFQEPSLIPIKAIECDDCVPINVNNTSGSGSNSSSTTTTRMTATSTATDVIVVDETPSLRITYYNTDIGRKYRHEIEKFFHTLMTTENISKSHERLPSLQPRPNLSLSEHGTLTSTTVIGEMEASILLLCCLCRM